MKMKKISLLLSILVIFASCQPRAAKSVQNSLKINLKDEPQTLDPRQTREISGLTLMKMFFEGLTRIGPSDMPELALAQGVEISEDLKTYTFYLRESYWSNGDPVEAEDFIYSWQTTLSPDFRADQAFQLYPIKNAKEIKLGDKPLEDLGVRALDSRTLVVELEYPLPYLLELIAFPAFFPINRHVDRRESHWADRIGDYVCNGPFKPVEWKHHYFLRAESNDSYWDASEVHLEQIEMAMVPELTELELYETKALHWAGSPLSRIPLDAIETLEETMDVHRRAILGTTFVQANVEKGLLSNRNLRHALSLAIDRSAVASGIQTPATQFVPPSLGLAYASDVQEGDQEAACALFEKALEELELTRDQLPQITFTHVASEQGRRIAQILQDQWRRTLGLTVQLDGIERKVFFDRLSRGDYEMVYRDWIADYNDPINFLEVFKYKQQSTNNSGWEDPAYSQLLDDSCQCGDMQRRLELLTQCEKILLDAMPIIPLLHHNMLYIKDERLEGVFLSSLGHLDFKWAYWKNAH